MKGGMCIRRARKCQEFVCSPHGLLLEALGGDVLLVQVEQAGLDVRQAVAAPLGHGLGPGRQAHSVPGGDRVRERSQEEKGGREGKKEIREEREGKRERR